MAFPFSLADMLAAINTNPVGTERFGDQSMTGPSPDTMPATTWGDYPVSQRLYNAGQNAIGNALGWVGGTETPGIRAFHGSPYDFNAFDMSKIGSGEGAQAYGHGLYFAGNEGVAQAYKKQLAPLGNLAQGATGAQGLAARALQRANGDAAGASKSLDYNLAIHKAGNGGQIDPDFQARVDQARQLLASPNAAGKMYEVNLNVQPQQLLDWDKPLSEQSPQVQAALNAQAHPTVAHVMQKSTENPNYNGADLYQRLSSTGKTVGSDFLRQAGIPGIQYLDQGSRTAGEGTRNYVMFDPSLIEILRKYLFPATTVGGTAALASQQRQ